MSEILLDKENIVAEFAQKAQVKPSDPSSQWQGIRQKALEYFQKLDIPSPKHEEWKYTNVKKILKNPYQVAPESDLTQSDLENTQLSNLDTYQIWFVNAQFRADLSNLPNPESGVLVQSLKEALENGNTDAQNHFNSLSNNEEEAFTAMNTALAEEGLFIQVAKNKSLDKPLQVFYILDAREKSVFVPLRNLIVLAEGAELNLIESVSTQGAGESLGNFFTEIIQQPNSRFQHYKIQDDQKQAHLIGTTQVHQPKDSFYHNVTISLEGGLIRNNLNIALAGENVESNMYGLYMLKGKTLVDNHSIADHQQPNSLSNELYKGILDDASTGVFNGKIFVRQDAQKTNAYQQNRNVLLSDEASINTKPQLEIWADDVKCSHGATTGSLDEGALFYLRSRGIPKAQARRLLVHAFGNEIIEQIKFEALREYLEQRILDQM